ncbi:DNA-binding response regulator [Pseudoroseomonas deserti]|uniref:DNA-binding response regulator n=1 Tax=Teichococcus deserti TaxID=1817963 RepID=A0A1V2H653_9PROT|nr:response regulator [Pseudoroseomonas deserti]ONG56062.1 DNA-binding response regulator [Pseudoroseomonas deserti]
MPPPAEQGFVHVVDDDPDVLEAIGELLLSVGLRPALFAAPGDFLASPRRRGGGCLVLDVRLPGQSGLAVFAGLRRDGLDLPVIFISGHADVPMAVKAMKAGAFDFFTKPVRNQDLLDTIHAALAEDAARRGRRQAQAALRAAHDGLSPREREVMALVAAGQMNKQIAGHIGISEATVKGHRMQLMRKMGLRSLADLVRAADRLATGD